MTQSEDSKSACEMKVYPRLLCLGTFWLRVDLGDDLWCVVLRRSLLFMNTSRDSRDTTFGSSSFVRSNVSSGYHLMTALRSDGQPKTSERYGRRRLPFGRSRPRVWNAVDNTLVGLLVCLSAASGPNPCYIPLRSHGTIDNRVVTAVIRPVASLQLY